MNHNKRGSVAITLTLLFVSTLLLTGTLVEAVSGVCARSYGESVADLAGRSILAEYDTKLFQEYGLLGVKSDSEQAEQKLGFYVGQSFENGKGLFHMKPGKPDVNFDGLSLVCPDRLEEQIREHMKYRVILDELKQKKILSQFQQAGNVKVDSDTSNLIADCSPVLMESASVEKEVRGLKKRWQSSGQTEEDRQRLMEGLEGLSVKIQTVKDRCHDFDVKAEAAGSGVVSQEIKHGVEEQKKWMDVLSHPREAAVSELFSGCVQKNGTEEGTEKINQIRRFNENSGMNSITEPVQLDVVLRKRSIISELPSTQMSVGKNILLPELEHLKKISTKNLSNMFYDDRYILALFENRLTEERGGTNRTLFHNEVEYILFGQYSDKKNGAYTKNELFFLRTGLNLAHIYSDTEKRTAIISLAESLAPGAVGVLLQAVLAGTWAAAEAENDVRLILGGHTVPIWKSPENWALSLDHIFEGFGENAVLPAKESGLNYVNYLELFLCLLERETKLVRVMDLIQINMKGRSDETFLLRQHRAGLHFIIPIEKRAGFPSVIPFGVRTGRLEATHLY